MQLNQYIDHTILKAEATASDIEKICAEAIKYQFASVCTNSCYTPLVTNLLNQSAVNICAVVGFPLGAMATSAKAYETENACRDGANEIDMVLNIGALKGGSHNMVYSDIKAVCKAAHNQGAIVKVILECCLLTNQEKETACQISMDAGAAFVKTSTGFSSGGATIEDITLMKAVVGNTIKIKASGGVRSYADAMAMINAGADRIGTSNGVAIIKGEVATKDY